jgi:two-component sensor histidine kinase/CheY-like chemotaxis protein
LSIQHHRILLDELQHRVRNIMAMTTSLTARTARTADNAKDYAALLSGRLAAMARTQTLLTHAVGEGVEIGTLISDELRAQADHAGQYEMSGPRVVLSAKATEVLTLALHELATNALKYGALSSSEGKVRITWRLVQQSGHPHLRLMWSETRPPTADWRPPTRRGFGTSLIEDRVPYELLGRGKVEITAQGAHAWMEFPLRDGASILETAPPILATVSGGSIDMSKIPLLSGKRILVVEDDFYLASDLAAALRNAGAAVVGPFGVEERALDAVEAEPIDAAVLDINLGRGPSFAIPRALQQGGVPCIRLTGYSPSSIPDDLVSVPIVPKPANLTQLVEKLAGTLEASSLQ